MARPIEVSVLIAATLRQVWAELSDFASHPEWMDDAATVRFLTDQTTGLGTRIEAATRVGPLRAADVMVVVRWDEEQTIVVEHVGAVKGYGRFDIGRVGDHTEMRWVEDLRFPWWLGGPLGLALARPILGRIWRGSLRRLKDRLELSAP
jgi:hypothetical protein